MCYFVGNEEGVVFELGSDIIIVVFIFECGMFRRWEIEGMGISWEICSS